jgi:hypothetical protein
MKGATMIFRRRLNWITLAIPFFVVLVAASAAAAPSASASAHQGSMAKATRGISSAPESPSSLPAKYKPVTVTIITATNRASASNGDPCKSGYEQVNNNDVFGITLFWFRMNTTWCYNGLTVTSHTTTLHQGVDLTGEIGGWEWIGNSAISFHCFVTEQNTRKCAGNFESAHGYFYNVDDGFSCNDYIYEEQYYNGDWNSHGSTTC